MVVTSLEVLQPAWIPHLPMKLKNNQTRTYDRDGYKRRAACVCFRDGSEDEVGGATWLSRPGGLPEMPLLVIYLGVMASSFASLAVCSINVEIATARKKSLEIYGNLAINVLLVSSSRYPDRWIVPGGGLEPEEEASAAASREVYEEAGVKGTLGRLLGVFENFERKHRTFVYVLTVTEVLDDWEDSVNIGRKRRWFSIEEAVRALQGHKPVQASYFQSLRQNCHPNNGAIPLPSQSSLPDVR